MASLDSGTSGTEQTYHRAGTASQTRMEYQTYLKLQKAVVKVGTKANNAAVKKRTGAKITRVVQTAAQ